MKIRNGFVSNSSSSSFICRVCGETASGYDLDYSSYGLCECVHGHEFCEDHLVQYDCDELTAFLKTEIESYKKEIIKLDKKSKEKRIAENIADDDKEYYDRYNSRSEHAMIEDYESMLADLDSVENVNDYITELIDESLNDRRYEVAAYCCPICTLDHIDTKNVLKYIAETRGLDISKINNEIRDNYKTLTSFDNRK